MRILAVYRHFWPDSPPYASMLRTITAHLVQDGHEVSVLSEQPGYKAGDRAISAPVAETISGVRVRRLRRLPGGRFNLFHKAAGALFPVRVVLNALVRRLRGERYDILWTATIPPAINGLGGWVAARLLGAKFVYHLQDIYPELAVHAGNWPERGLLSRTIGWIDRLNTQRADACIVLSDDMARTVEARGVDSGAVHVINNFMLDGFERDTVVPAELAKTSGRVRIIFAGNIGRFQGLEAFIEAARRIEHELPDVEFILLGDGVQVKTLKSAAHDLSNVRFVPHMPFDAAKSVIATADFGLVSLQAGIYRTAYPSKTLTYLGLGVPVLAVIEPESVLARTILDEGVGTVAVDPSPDAIADAIRQAYTYRSEITDMRARAIKLYQSTLSSKAALAKWSRLIRSLGPS